MSQSAIEEPEQDQMEYYTGPSNEEIGDALVAPHELSREYTRRLEDEEMAHTRSRPSDEASSPHHAGNEDTPGKGSSQSSLDQQQKRQQHQQGQNEKSSPQGDPTPPSGGMPQKVGLFHSSLSGLRMKILLAHLKVWLFMGMLIIASFSVYWGALYNRVGNIHRFDMLVVVEDEAVGDLQPLIGNEIQALLATEEFRARGTWHVYNTTESINSKFNNPENLTAAIVESIHHRKYWSAVHVFPNVTFDQYQLYQGNISNVPMAVQFVYESGRDINSVKPYVVPTLQGLQDAFNLRFGGAVSSDLLQSVSDEQKVNLMNNSTLVTTLPLFSYFDNRPYLDSTLLAPLQVGLIYLIILSFFLFNFFAQVHMLLVPLVHIHQYLLYRIICTHISYLIIALFISTVSAIFQISFTVEFGRAGFVIYWFTTYLVMAAVGGANENMALLLFTYNPPFLGFWLISFVILNVSPSFSPMALVSNFYRYGYMMPIYHASEIFKVIFLGLWKGQLGMHYGVIAAWIVVNTLLLPFILKHVGGVMAKRAKAEKEKAAAAAAEMVRN